MEPVPGRTREYDPEQYGTYEPGQYREYDPDELREYKPVHPRGTDWRGLFKKIWAPLLAIGAFLAKFGGLIFKGKFFVSIFVSAAVYVWLGGWIFGIGLVLLLFVHEMGHVLEAKRQGLPVSAPVFIPFLGAAITLKQMPPNAWREAQIALAGPLVGSAGAVGVWVYGEATDSRAVQALAFLGFLINLFNLLPIPPLDGGRAVGALHPSLWFVGLVGLVGLAVWRPNPLLILIVIIAAFELWNRWKTRHYAESQSYYKVLPWQRVAVAVVYFGLAILLVLGMQATHVPRDF
jgi:Zn-dependent protease